MKEMSDITRRSHRFWDNLRISTAAGIGLLLSLAAGYSVWRWEDRVTKQEFNALAESDILTLQNGLNLYLSKLAALRALFESSADVSRNEFEMFTGRLLLHQSAIQNFSWVPRVMRAERAAHESAAARDGIADYRIKSVAPDNNIVPSEDREEYLPIFYSSVTSRKSPIYGIDLRSQPLIERPLDRARDQDQLSAVPDFVLHSATGDKHGFLFSLPVYRQGLPHDTVEDRRRNLVGFVHGAFLTAEAFGNIIDTSTTAHPVDLYLFMADAGSAAPPLYVYSSRLRTEPAEQKSEAALDAGPHWSGELKAGDARWSLMVVPIPGGTMGTGHRQAWVVLAAGLLVGGLVLANMSASDRYARRIEALARTDPLTTLTNRRGFVARLTLAFADARRGGSPFGVLYLDLDDFKDVNDTLGHAIGDALLRQVVERLKKTARPTDLVARFGGDEFAILQADASDPIAAATLAARIGTCLAAPFTIEGHEVRVTASIGISSYSADVVGAEAMMIQADLALYRAKDDGRNCFRFHTGELDQQVHLRVTLAGELRVAIDGAELELYYQPLVDIVSGRIVGLEALVRWNHPTRGLIMPLIFIPIAERTGAIVPLGHWVFEEACRQLNRWRDQGIAPQALAVNVSGVQFKRASDLELDIGVTLARWGIKSGNIEIEITETVLMEMTQKHGDALERLRQLGVRIAIDDFGTGYSSLKYLTMYPVNRLKIAQELVCRVTTDSRNATVVRAAIRLAQELGIEVIAEGVETEAQVNFLLSAGCAYGQGYYFSRPVNAERATELLRRGLIKPARDLLRVIETTAA
jgi:diguanylate cyclase (GGDEF)-like protein